MTEAAPRAKPLRALLPPDVAATGPGAILEARTAARILARRVEKAGEQAAVVVAQVSTARIESARFQFLDLDESGAPVQPEAPAGRGIDLDPAPSSSAAPQLPFTLE